MGHTGNKDSLWGRVRKREGGDCWPRSLNGSVRPQQWENYPSTGEGTTLHHNRSKGGKINTNKHNTVHVLVGNRRNFHLMEPLSRIVTWPPLLTADRGLDGIPLQDRHLPPSPHRGQGLRAGVWGAAGQRRRMKTLANGDRTTGDHRHVTRATDFPSYLWLWFHRCTEVYSWIMCNSVSSDFTSIQVKKNTHKMITGSIKDHARNGSHPCMLPISGLRSQRCKTINLPVLFMCFYFSNHVLLRGLFSTWSFLIASV